MYERIKKKLVEVHALRGQGMESGSLMDAVKFAISSEEGRVMTVLRQRDPTSTIRERERETSNEVFEHVIHVTNPIMSEP